MVNYVIINKVVGKNMIRGRMTKRISVLIAVTLIICSMSAFILPKNTKADNTEEVTTSQEETTPEETTQPVDPDKYELIAHRGFSGYAPENSMPAFEKAVAAGFTRIEFDIRRTKEDSNGNAVWVVSHDDSLERTMGVKKNISDLTYSQILKYSYTDGNNISSYKNLKIVSLPQMIEYMKKVKTSGKDVSWNLEIKIFDDYSHTQYFEDEIVKPLEEAGVDDIVSVISFDHTYLQLIKKINPNIKTHYLTKEIDDDSYVYARKANVDGIIFKGTINNTPEEVVKKVISDGYQVGVYTVDSKVIMGAYYRMGVRTFTTNKVGPKHMTTALMKSDYNVKNFTYTLSKKTYTFTNKRKKPKVTVTYDGEKLLEGLNYELSYSNNKYPGKGVVTVSGINNCVGEKDKKFNIGMPKVTEFEIAKNGTNYIKLKWKQNDAVTGYKVFSYNYRTKKYVQVKDITKNSKHTYKVKKLNSAFKYRFRVKTYLKHSSKTYTSKACSAITTYTTPGKTKSVSISKLSSGKCLVSYSRIQRVSGYRIKIATNKKFTKNVRIINTKSKKGRCKIKNIKKGKKYYVRVKGYIKRGKKYYYGSYSKVAKKKL